MAIDLNLDMGAVFKNLMNKNKGGTGSNIDIMTKIKPFRNALLLLAITLTVFAAYFKMYYVPMRDENKKKSDEIARLIDLKNKTVELEGKIATLKKRLTESKEHYLESLSHFGNSEDLGALYQSVSTLASKYDLVVLNIKEVALKATPAPAAATPTIASPSVGKDGKPIAAVKPKDKKSKAAENPASKVKEVQVQVEIKGKYFSYVKFKEDLAIAEMLLKVNSENIKVKNDKEDPGSIYVTLNLSTYAIDKKPFEQAMEAEVK
ncbi:MAG: hypothetical protein K0R98_512 [Rickettsiaceae bacterium]|jgi:Tfp pilus assembly protein PilO|nr:hypothetical protein [Rickettsiaceae bacterium]